MGANPIFPESIQNHTLEIDNADGTTTQSLVAAGTNGTRVNSISVSSTDTADAALFLYHYDGAADFYLGKVTIPDGSGFNGTVKAVSLLNQSDFPFLGDDLSYFLENGHSLRVAVESALTTAKVLNLVAICGDY